MNLAQKIFAALAVVILLAAGAQARQSREWQKTLDDRTAMLWIDAQFLDDIVLNARARVEATWLPRSLVRRLRRDNDIEEWARTALGFYFRSDPEAAAQIKGFDVLAVRYRAEKNWTFDPTTLTIGDYKVTSDDLLGPADSWLIGDIPSGSEAMLLVRIPPLTPGQTVRITLGPDSADLTAPRR